MKRILTIAIILMVAIVANAETLTWNAATSDYGTASNWSSISGLSPTSVDEVRFDNGGTATISSGSHDANKFYMGRLAGKSGNLSMSGGSLTVATAGYIASAGSTSGNLTMTGSSALTIDGNFQVGSRGVGTMSVGSLATVDTSILYISSILNSQGTVDLAGTWEATKVLYSSSSAGTGRINLNDGSLTLSGDFDADNASVSSRLSVNGSSGYFSAANFLGASSTATLDFIADAGGFTTLNMVNAIDINGATLNIDLSSYSGALDVKLMDGDSLIGTFANVNITGGTGSESLVYDTANGNLVLVPEPATMGLFGLAGLMMLLLRKHIWG